MNTKLLVLAAALCAAACTRMENPAEERIPVSLTYTTVLATETKAAQDLNEGALAEGTEVAVRIRNTGSGNNWTQYIFTVAADGTLTPSGEPPYYPDGDGRIDIVAYCPASSAAADDFVAIFSVPTDQTSDDAYKAADVMFASVPDQGRTTAPVELAFTHLTSKLNVNITPGAGVETINSVRILNVICSGHFAVTSGLVLTGSFASPTSIAVSNNGAACFPKQTISGELISIETDQGTATYSLSEEKEFEAGKQYTFNLTVNLREVGLMNEITDWTENGEVRLKYDLAKPIGLEAVDLGLYEGGASSGKKLLWANMNVGATSVTDYGYYFAWGEVTGHSGDEGYYFPASDYPYFSIHGGNIEVYMYNNADGLTVLKPSHDAATVHWGDGWRMPTKEEFEALLALTKGRTAQDGVNGYRFTGNGKSIFLPAASILQTYGLGSGYYGYWSSSRDSSSPSDSIDSIWSWSLFFTEDLDAHMVGYVDGYLTSRRPNGMTVRPVRTN